MKREKVSVWIAVSILILSISCYIIGLITPIIETSTHVFGFNFNSQEMTLLDTIEVFYNTKDYLLAIIVLLFTIVTPLISYVYLIYRVVKTIKNTYSKASFNIDKWNMLDVFVVALLVLNFKMGNSLMAMNVQYGTIYIAVAVLSRIFLVGILDSVIGRKKTQSI